MSVSIPWWLASPLLALIGLAAIIVPLATHWPEPSVAIGLGAGAVLAAIWAGVRGIAASLSGSASTSSASVKVTYTIDGLDWAVMSGLVILGIVVGLVIQFTT